jgi:hypothetical protein
VVINVTFNSFSVISWQSVLLVEETRVLGENRNFNELLPILYTILSKLQISHRFVLFLLVLRINMNMRCIGIGDALENYVNCLLLYRNHTGLLKIITESA